MIRRYTAYIFDLDGTLTRPGLIDFDAIKRQIGCPPGQTILEFLDGLAGEALRDAWAVIDAVERESVTWTAANFAVYQVMAELAATGAQCFILTRNGRWATRATLQHLGLAPYITDMVCREDAAPKPDPEGIRTLESRWRLDPGRTLMVGDYRFDVATGAAAGVATAFLTNRRPDNNLDGLPLGHPTHVIQDLPALLRLG